MCFLSCEFFTRFRFVLERMLRHRRLESIASVETLIELTQTPKSGSYTWSEKKENIESFIKNHVPSSYIAVKFGREAPQVL